MQDLGLKKLYVIYSGTRSYPLDQNIQAVPLSPDLGKLKNKFK